MVNERNEMTFWGAVCVVVGSIIGSGILIAPALIAQFSSSLVVIASIWILGAAMCLCGGVIYSRLAQTLPQSGGQYIFIRESLSQKLAAVYGWMSFLAICPLMIAGAALFFGEQLKVFFPGISSFSIKTIGISLSFVLTYLNHRGINLAGRFQGLLVVFLLIVLLSLIFSSLLHLSPSGISTYWGGVDFSFGSMDKGLLALAMVLWSFEGFNSATFITGEIKNGAQRITKILFIGLAVVTVIYLAFIGCAHLYIPHSTLVSNSNAGAELASMAMGPSGKFVVFLLACLGAVTSLHTSIIIGPRITKSLAADGLCWSELSFTHAKYASPSRALWVQFLLVSLFLVFGSFQSLISLFVVINWFFYGVTAFGYLALCKIRQKKVSIWEKTSVFFFLSGVFLLLFFQFISYPALSTLGLGLVIALSLVPRHIPRLLKRATAT